MTPVTGEAGPGAHLLRALAAQPDDAWVLMRAVRDDSGTVRDLDHVWVNATAEHNSGRGLVGTTLLEAFGDRTATLVPTFVDLLRTGGERRLELVYGTDDDTDAVLRSRVFDVWMTRTDPDHVACRYRDVTALRRAEDGLRHQARHDELTGLPNRRLLREHLEVALARLGRGGAGVVVLLCDLDHFKDVNDTYGHSAGDDLLRLVGRRLRSVVRVPDLVARYGGDEFVVLAEHRDEAEVAALVRRLGAAVAETYRLPDGTEVAVELSIGVAVVTRGTSVDDALAEADRSLYAQKAARPPV
ncbi:GGDEF domain-containing protein [Actinotalea sp. AC32]|nr:GGDEF domain-containing protein [Actinotalea sp. AC32]